MMMMMMMIIIIIIMVIIISADSTYVKQNTATRQVSTAHSIVYTEVLTVVTSRTAQIPCVVVGVGGGTKDQTFSNC